MGMLNPANGVVFSTDFYRLGIPFIARIALVLVPMWYGVIGDDVAAWWWIVFRTVGATVLVGATFGQLTGALVSGWIPTSVVRRHFGTTLYLWTVQFPGWTKTLPFLFPLALAWPAAYLLIHERRRRLAA